MKILQNTLQGLGQIDATTAILLVIVLLVCLACLFMLFFYAGRVRSYGLHQQIILDSIKERKMAEEAHRITPLQIKEAGTRDAIAELERALESKRDDKKAQELNDQINAKRQELELAERRTQEMSVAIEREAELYAKSIVPGNVSLSEQFGPYFYIEFGTVIVIIFTLLGLALIEAIEGRDAATILAAIAGYVLGKVSSAPTSKQAS